MLFGPIITAELTDRNIYYTHTCKRIYNTHRLTISPTFSLDSFNRKPKGVQLKQEAFLSFFFFRKGSFCLKAFISKAAPDAALIVYIC